MSEAHVRNRKIIERYISSYLKANPERGVPVVTDRGNGWLELYLHHYTQRFRPSALESMAKRLEERTK